MNTQGTFNNSFAVDDNESDLQHMVVQNEMNKVTLFIEQLTNKLSLLNLLLKQDGLVVL